jgi:hypothetical protein
MTQALTVIKDDRHSYLMECSLLKRNDCNDNIVMENDVNRMLSSESMSLAERLVQVKEKRLVREEESSNESRRILRSSPLKDLEQRRRLICRISNHRQQTFGETISSNRMTASQHDRTHAEQHLDENGESTSNTHVDYSEMLHRTSTDEHHPFTDDKQTVNILSKDLARQHVTNDDRSMFERGYSGSYK